VLLYEEHSRRHKLVAHTKLSLKLVTSDIALFSVTEKLIMGFTESLFSVITLMGCIKYFKTSYAPIYGVV